MGRKFEERYLATLKGRDGRSMEDLGDVTKDDALQRAVIRGAGFVRLSRPRRPYDGLQGRVLLLAEDFV
jgi:hypothetical protein